MTRTHDDNWKLLEKATWEKCWPVRDKIRKKAPGIKRKFGFHESYDLADELIGAFAKYIRDSKRPGIASELAEHNKCMDEIQASKSLNNITTTGVIALSLAGLRSFDEPTNSKERHLLSKALRINRKEPKGLEEPKYREESNKSIASIAMQIASEKSKDQKKPQDVTTKRGRYPNVYNATLARKMASIYYHGTSKLPSSGGHQKIGGEYPSFARECLSLMGAHIPDKTLKKYMLVMRRHYNNKIR